MEDPEAKESPPLTANRKSPVPHDFFRPDRNVPVDITDRALPNRFFRSCWLPLRSVCGHNLIGKSFPSRFPDAICLNASDLKRKELFAVSLRPPPLVPHSQAPAEKSSSLPSMTSHIGADAAVDFLGPAFFFPPDRTPQESRNN